jgi:hypothetical protein
MGKDSFIFYKDWANVIKGLPEEVRLDVYDAVIEYAISGKLSDLKPMANVAFGFIKQTIDRDTEKGVKTGEHHWNWKGGVSSENHIIRNSSESKQWRKKVFSRDNYTCQHCNNKGGKLNAHHIKPFSIYPELRFELNNGITLCRTCHIELHKTEREWL